ncbi:MAG: sulfotransferase [Nitrospirota bacterium]
MVPVFIAGCGRSGTTLLGAMLGAHTECLCIPELPFKVDIFSYLQRTEKIKATDIMNKIRRNWRFQIWGLDITSPPLASGEVTSLEILEWIIKRYGQKVGKPNPSIWVDHTNNNIKYFSLLYEYFPNARMIHLVRDGRAVAASIIPLDWGPNTIDRAACFWMKRELRALAMETLWKTRAIRIRFEDLLHEPEATLRGLCSFLGIDFQSRMLRGSGFKVPRYTSDQHSLVGKELDTSRADGWEKKLTPRQVEIFESITGDVLLSYGYTLKFNLLAKKMTGMEKLGFDIQETVKRRINKFRRRHRRKKGIEMAALFSDS